MPNDVTEYLTTLAEPSRSVVNHVIAEARLLVPDATEGRSYGMPCLMHLGKPLLAVIVRKNWIAAYPYSGKAIAAAQKELAGFDITSGSVHFTPDHPLPARAIQALVTARRSEIENSD
ncbi:MAG: DUF1801 domain-containing protein [Promicromonosporaceae bacterium]|nr:DUF1801 domain-containing protein [Promicromonosporaceae bacterium]